ncbi:MAG: hypothetical protein ACXVY5_06265 [Gaiellales bacterium]
MRVEAGPGGEHICALRFAGIDGGTEREVVRFVFAQESRVAREQEKARLSVSLPAICRLPDAGNPLPARTVDLTAEELHLVTTERLPSGMGVHVEVHSSEALFELSADAAVASCRREGQRRWVSTLRFERVDRARRAAIIRLALEQQQRMAVRRSLSDL